jgi:hypothetical protein
VRYNYASYWKIKLYKFKIWCDIQKRRKNKEEPENIGGAAKELKDVFDGVRVSKK